MAHGKVTGILPAPSAAAFDLLHDYGRRLAWDTLLRAAYLEEPGAVAGKGVVAVCVGRRSLGGFALRTAYVSFERPRLAAVKMLNRPPFFDAWAASIRHEDLPGGRSRITYTYTFSARPRWAHTLLEPIMGQIFAWETRRRLRALGRYLRASAGGSAGAVVAD